MFSTPRKDAPKTTSREEVPPTLAAELATEFASLRAPGGCPRGMYVTCSPQTPLKWHGIFCVHRGPYAGSVLRFTITFPARYPDVRPVVTFDSDVYHPMIDPKTKEWTPAGRLQHWQPRVHHIPHLLHEIKRSFKTRYLETLTEEQATNKQTFLLWKNSRQTFLSMTAQRALHSAIPDTLLSPTSSPKASLRSLPPSPTSVKHPSGHQRQSSIAASVTAEENENLIRFKRLTAEEVDALRHGMKHTLLM